MDVKDIVIKYLKKNNYHGLCEPSLECGCGIDDFAPCGGMKMECKPAYLHIDGLFWEAHIPTDSGDASQE